MSSMDSSYPCFPRRDPFRNAVYIRSNAKLSPCHSDLGCKHWVALSWKGSFRCPCARSVGLGLVKLHLPFVAGPSPIMWRRYKHLAPVPITLVAAVMLASLMAPCYMASLIPNLMRGHFNVSPPKAHLLVLLFPKAVLIHTGR